MKNNIKGLILKPNMFGDCFYIENKMIKNGYAKKHSCVTMRGYSTYIYDSYQIDGQIDIIFDINSKYGVMWFFPN